MYKRSGFTLIELLVVMVIIAGLASILFPVITQVRARAHQSVCLSNIRQISLGVLEYIQDHDEYYPIGATSGDPSGQPNDRWYLDVETYVKGRGASGVGPNIYVCPAEPLYKTLAGGYGINANLVCAIQGGVQFGTSKKYSEIGDPISTFVLCDTAQLDPSLIAGYNSTPQRWSDIETGPSDFQTTPPSSWTGDNNFYTEAPDADFSRRPVVRHHSGLNIAYCDGHAKWSHIEDFLGPMPAGWPYGDPRNSWDNK